MPKIVDRGQHIKDMLTGLGGGIGGAMTLPSVDGAQNPAWPIMGQNMQTAAANGKMNPTAFGMMPTAPAPKTPSANGTLSPNTPAAIAPPQSGALPPGAAASTQPNQVSPLPNSTARVQSAFGNRPTVQSIPPMSKAQEDAQWGIKPPVQRYQPDPAVVAKAQSQLNAASAAPHGTPSTMNGSGNLNVLGPANATAAKTIVPKNDKHAKALQMIADRRASREQAKGDGQYHQMPGEKFTQAEVNAEHNQAVAQQKATAAQAKAGQHKLRQPSLHDLDTLRPPEGKPYLLNDAGKWIENPDYIRETPSQSRKRRALAIDDYNALYMNSPDASPESLPQDEISQEDLEHTAKLYGITVEEVKKRMAANSAG